MLYSVEKKAYQVLPRDLPLRRYCYNKRIRDSLYLQHLRGTIFFIIERSFNVKRKDGAVLNLTGNLLDNQKYSPVLSTLAKELFEQVLSRGLDEKVIAQKKIDM